MKIVFSDRKTGKTGQLDIAKDSESAFVGKKIGEVVEGTAAGLPGYKLKVTGLSDTTGSPSRREIEGTRKARPLLSHGIGMKVRTKGFRARRLVRGNTISTETAQINTVIEEYGAMAAEELFKPKEKKE
ncbi:MAG TPA: 30S ribosomal protein S6e [Candidatus Saccharimonadales bacterium]|nr:30S ribosomal protein S6e [Candidatus Saccharimonadales bacterium]